MFGTKVTLAGRVVYYTIEVGVRKDSEHSTEMYSKTYKAPYIKEVPVEVPALSEIPDLCYTTKNCWNKGIMTSFEFVSNLPNKTVQWSEQGYEYASKELNADQQKNPTPTKS
ncbi:hypothetical protein C0J52_21326 [Blattella germanica]|nr:hypothetical protein C0J52_21326 [Blattella germanica]